MAEVVKVQVPLLSFGREATLDKMLVYDKRRSRVVEQPLPDAVRHKLGGDAKGFFRGRWTKGVGWSLGERVADQYW